MSVETTEQSTLLIVDDNPSNLGMISDFLAHSGFKVLVALNGENAIQKLEDVLPDLILLDILMPGTDGFEICRRLKANKLTKDIPVIFMTALTGTMRKIEGLNLGAVDYITKPLQHEEVLARVKLHLSLRHLTKRLQEQNVRLEQEIEERLSAEAALLQLTSQLERRVEERTAELSTANERLKQEVQERLQAEVALQQSEVHLRTQAQWLEQALRELQHTQTQLIQSEKMSSLGQMVAGVAHEINNPVNFIYGNLSHADRYISDLTHLLHLYQQYCPVVPEIQKETRAIDLEFLIEDLPKVLNSMHMGADRIREIVQSLRNFSRLDEANIKRVNIHEGIDSTLLILQHRLKARPDHPGIQVIKEYGPLPHVECYAGQMNQVFMNLLANAVDALEGEVGSSIPTPCIWIRTEVIDRSFISVTIADNGAGMTEKVRSRAFDPFFTTKPVGKGTGIGLSISHQIVVEKHSGQLKCVSKLGQGTKFIVEIPMRQRYEEPALFQRA